MSKWPQGQMKASWQTDAAPLPVLTHRMNFVANGKQFMIKRCLSKAKGVQSFLALSKLPCVHPVFIYFAYIRRSGLLDNMRAIVLFCFLFWGIPILFSNLHSHQLHTSISSSPYTLKHLLFFVDSYFDWCEAIAHCGYDLHFSNN